jgi:hypothetical protein
MERKKRAAPKKAANSKVSYMVYLKYSIILLGYEK